LRRGRRRLNHEDGDAFKGLQWRLGLGSGRSRRRWRRRDINVRLASCARAPVAPVANLAVQHLITR